MRPADVVLVSEGAYPFVTGGLSHWIQQLASGMPDLSFEVVTLVAGREERAHRYALPRNVRALHVIDILDAPATAPRAAREPDPLLLSSVRRLATAGARPGAGGSPFADLLAALERAGGASAELLASHDAWSVLVEAYRERAPRQSFLDFFWTCRAMLPPLLSCIAADLPPAAVYHAASTGYAGLLGALAARRHGARFILTEHGSYTREREVELARADWIHVPPAETSPWVPRAEFFKEWWADYFELLASHAYAHADLILALNEVGTGLQARAGAPPAKLRAIPNGVDVARFAPLRRRHDWSDRPFRVGFVGRVVPVKDVKTFLRAIATARQEIPALEAVLVGPTDEVPLYLRECEDLVALLEIGDIARFTGPADVREYLGQMDVLVLTSLTEAQPLVVLEAFAAGVPVVCSDVGGCRELVLGGSAPGDRDIGPSGILTRAARPAETAAALVALWRDPLLHAALRDAAIARAAGFYDEKRLLAAYRRVYAGKEP
ncbi:MAG: GT4 family glycosyltransferase PelF [Candidatus Sericytochromatia bacterium]|nr:GT4 family glycosyltransferase PelF [Candidatus Tanganyikabacteria bacterium]